MPSLGQQIGRYRITSIIGAGGMGEVYLADDTQLKRRIALKLLPAGVAKNPERLRRFEKEAYAVASLNHPNIAHIYEIGEDDGEHFIAMEYVDGVTLHEKIHHDRTPLRKLLKYLIETAAGLAKAHQAGIVHRDLKPENIMVARDDYAKILDFGLVKLVESHNGSARNDDSDETATAILDQQSTPGMILGTVGYMSPEQAQGKVNEIDQRSDIFSFGCILFEAATRQRAFQGEDTIDTLHKILHAPAPRIQDFDLNAPADLQRIVRRCLAKDPEKRYQSIKEVAIELEELQQELGDWPAQTPSHNSDIASRQTALLTDQTITYPDSGAPLTGGQTASIDSSRRDGTSGRKYRYAAIAAVSLLITVGLAVGLYRYSGWGQSAPRGPLKITPLTSSPNTERSPTFSPDGRQIAYTWVGEDREPNFDIYVKITDAGTPLRLTTNPARDMSPAWSPDGRYIAFLRGNGPDKGFYIVPALGGPERRIADAFLWNQQGVRNQGIDWSPDGKFLVVVDKESTDEPWAIFTLSLETGQRIRLTTPPQHLTGDIQPALSPDGSTVAFIRTSAGTANIYTVAIAGGDPVPVTTSEYWFLRGIGWTNDGKSIVYSGESAGAAGVWRVPVAGGTPEPLPDLGGSFVYEFSISPKGNQLVFAQGTEDLNVWRREIPKRNAGGQLGTQTEQLISSSRGEGQAQYSPDGQKIVFLSDRSGTLELWVSDSEGRNPAQVTQTGIGRPENPRWSPDGQLIAFEWSVGGNRDIYLVNSNGGPPRRLTTESSLETVPSWSRDGKYIYFSSKRSGRSEIWKMPATGGEALQITKNGGFSSSESPDGRTLYYTKDQDSSLWAVGVEGGEETQVLNSNIGRRWYLVQSGIYYLSSSPNPPFRYILNFFDFEKRTNDELLTIESTQRGFMVNSLTVSPDERWIVYTQRDHFDFDINLAENVQF